MTTTTGGTMGKHYHLFIITTGKNDFTREYFEMDSPEETIEEGTERFLEEQLGARQRNRTKEKDRLQGLIESHKFCHPSSWHREQQLLNGTTTTTKKTRRK